MVEDAGVDLKRLGDVMCYNSDLDCSASVELITTQTVLGNEPSSL